jgi:general secretion pathway protein L
MSAVLTPPRRPRAWGLLILHGAGRLEIFLPGSPARLSASIDSDGAVPRLPKAVRAVSAPDTVLRLSAGDVLERTLQIPKAAKDVIEPVIENQLERLVPWPREATCYGYRLTGTSTQSPDQLDVHVVATPRYIVDAALDRLRRIGLSPQLVDYAPDPNEPIGVPLLSLAPDTRKRTAALLHVACMMLLGLAVLASMAGAYSAWDLRERHKSMEAGISERQSRLAEIRSRGKLAQAYKQHHAKLAQRRLEEPAAVILIEALSRALPNSAYLTELDIRGREVRIAGRSPDPTQLIALLESSPQFENVAFSAPTTREETGGLRAFSITARTRADALGER